MTCAEQCNHAKNCTVHDAVVAVCPVDWTQVDPNKRMEKKKCKCCMYITLYCLESFLAVQKMYNKGTITTSTPPKQLKTRLALCFFCMESKAFKLWLQEWSLQTREPPHPHTLGRGSLDLCFRLQDHLAWNVCWEFHLKIFDGNSLRSLFFLNWVQNPDIENMIVKFVLLQFATIVLIQNNQGQSQIATPKLTSFATYNWA